jgi:hypothetical protein
VGPDRDPDLLRELLTSQEPDELRSYLVVPRTGVPMFEGTTVPILGARELAQSSEGLIVPRGQTGSDILAGTYLTSTEYLDIDSDEMELYVRELAGQHELVEMVAQVAGLNHLVGQPDELKRLQEAFASQLKEPTRTRFEAAMQSKPGQLKMFLARQPLLACMRYLLSTDPPGEPLRNQHPTLVAILLAHAMASTLDASGDDTGEVLGTYPAYLVLEVVRTAGLGETTDIYASVDRVVRLWRDYGPLVSRGGRKEKPLDLLKQATGLDLDEILAPAFVMLARRVSGLRGQPIFDPPDLRVRMDQGNLDAFLRLVASHPAELRAELEKQPDRFGFLPFEKSPVLVTERGLLVLDEDYLWARVTSGLYWVVHDYLKFDKAPGTDLNLRWNDAYGEMVERLVEDAVSSMAPPILGSGGGKSFFTEEDFARAYDSEKRIDAAAYFGPTLLLVEVVRGQLSVPTRIEGSVRKFEADTDRLVIDKCRQLDAAATAVLGNETAVTHFPPTPGLRILPMVVIGGGYPVNPLTMSYVRQLMVQESLLQDSRLDPLAILDLEELEILEGLTEQGHSPVDVMNDWKRSPRSDAPFKNFVAAASMWAPEMRPERMRIGVAETFGRLIGVLGIAKEDSST